MRLDGVVAVALLWASGTVVVHQLPNPIGPAYAAALGLAAVVAWRLFGWRWCLWFTAGALWTSAHIHARLADRLAPELQGANVSVSGWVDDFPSQARGQVSFSFRLASEQRGRGIPNRLRLTWYDPPEPVKPAAALDLVVRLKPPRGLQNPGGFDYERWLFQEGYGATGYVREGRWVTEKPPGIGQRWLDLRARLANAIGNSVLMEDAAALLVALTIGERFGFAERQWRTLRRTGTSHLVAISGLHVGLVAGFGFFLTRRLALRLPMTIAIRDLELAAIVSLGAAAVYAGLAGFTVPTQRALIMLTVMLVALLGRRRVAMTSGLSVALLFVLVWDPLAPLSASFWMSFVAVALLWQLVRNGPPAVSRWQSLAAIARIQWGISLGLVPVVAFFFAEVSLVSPLVNIAAIPLFSFLLVPLTLIAALTSLLHPVGGILLSLAGSLMQWTWNGLVWVGDLPWAATSLSRSPWWVYALSWGGAMIALVSYPLPARNLAWLTLLPLFVSKSSRLTAGSVVAEILDVGHGLAVMVETRTHTLLYDAGPLYRSGFDTAEEIILPAIRDRDWGLLDILVVSHADNDHAGGSARVVQAYPDAKIIMGPDVSLPGGTTCEAGQSWGWDGVDFRILHPTGTFPYRGNDSSCVLRITTSAGSLLLAGDIEAAGERSLTARTDELGAEVIVVPHHGSATSSSPSLVVAVRPTYALVSAGYRNQWGFPKPEVLERWHQVGAQTLVTGIVGAIKVTFDPVRGIEIETRRSLRHRYWSADSVAATAR